MRMCFVWLTEENLWDKLVCREELLTFDLARIEEEVYDCHDDWRCLVSDACVVCVPFDNDKQVHVAENRKKKDALWEELIQQLGHVLEVNRVKAFLDDTESHVCDGQNDRNFHLEGVEER